MFITTYLQQQVDEKLNGDVSRFDELWTLIPNFNQELRRFDADGSWLHWTPKTFDGWYCVQVSSGFDVYFQERGSREESKHFADEKEAIKFAIDTAVFSLTAKNQ